MTKSFNELRENLSPERRLRNRRLAVSMLLEMTLQELQEVIGAFSDDDVDEMLAFNQGYLEKFKNAKAARRLYMLMHNELSGALKRAGVHNASIGSMGAPEGVDSDWVICWDVDDYSCFLEPVHVDDDGIKHWRVSTGEDHATLHDAAEGTVATFLRQRSTE